MFKSIFKRLSHTVFLHTKILVHEFLLGGYGEEVTPDPIPNSEVKLLLADGTARKSVVE